MLLQLISQFFTKEYICIFIITAICVYYLYEAFVCRIPGPIGAPFLGWYPFITKPLHYEFTELSKKYGKIFQVRMGVRRVVVLSDADIIHEAFAQSNDFAERPDLPTLRTFCKLTPYAFTFRKGQFHLERKAASRALALFSTSKNKKLEVLAHHTLEFFFTEVDSHIKEPWNPNIAVQNLVLGFVGPALFGMQYHPEHPGLRALHASVHILSDFFGNCNAMNYLPFGDILFFFHRAQFVKAFTPIMGMIHEHSQIKAVKFPEGPTTDVIQNLIKDLFPDGNIDERLVFGVSQDLFGAGFMTSMLTILWSLNILAIRQDIQDKLHFEIKEVLRGEKPTLMDIPSLTYMEAVINETLRFVSLSPLNLWHVATVNAKIRGWAVPKGTIVFPNTWAIHHDPVTFPNPFSYNPERFIMEDGSIDQNLVKKLAVFGIGKRRCIGETLARQEMFLMIASILQKYRIKMSTKDAVEDGCAVEGFLRTAKQYELIFDYA